MKSTRSYAFSENSEYREVLIVARKAKPCPDHLVKVCFVKTDLGKLTDEDIDHIANQIKARDHLSV